ncbi:MAG: hemerythrin family protein [Rhodocyclales bacterium]|nr:hemerythrin family protein [Rhodocyclales bacterium]
MAGQENGATLLEWHEGLSTGRDTLDVQHKDLFECVNLLGVVAQERSMMRTFYVLEQLSMYVHNHFAHEEYLMRLHDYPGLADHVREHREFTNKLHHLRRTYLDRDITSDLVEFLRDWLVRHVAQSDMEYVPYLTVERRLDLTPLAVEAMPAAGNPVRH